jgi:hypothetical protein
MLKNYAKGSPFLHWFCAVFIWLPLPLVIITDAIFEIYHQIAFPLYKIPKLNRDEYIQVIDRNKLQYLNWVEKLGCMYCGYMNGWFPYASEICHRTEKYWCGIMHQNKPGFKTQKHQLDQDFAKFDDQKDFEEKYGSKTTI